MKRKTWKRSQKKLLDIADGCSIASPPWTRFKTKQAAYQGGWNARIEEECLRKELQPTKTDTRERELAAQALRDICQAGTTVIESMSKALLSLQGNL